MQPRLYARQVFQAPSKGRVVAPNSFARQAKSLACPLHSSSVAGKKKRAPKTEIRSAIQR